MRGQRIHYEDSGGAGLALVLSHGFLQDSSMFDAQARQLRPRHQLLEMVAAIIVGNKRPESATWIAKWRSLDPAKLTYIYRTLMDRDDITGRLGEIRVPAIVIHGTEDVAIDISMAEKLCANL